MAIMQLPLFVTIMRQWLAIIMHHVSGTIAHQLTMAIAGIIIIRAVIIIEGTIIIEVIIGLISGIAIVGTTAGTAAEATINGNVKY